MINTRAKVVTPNRITHLSSCEVFVFGSNLAGQHGGGAARMAYEQFGAEWGVGVGPTGQCYAIPTMQGGLDTIRPYVEEFIEYAKAHPMNRFLVTRVGCGIAGFTDNQMAPLFGEAMFVPNITLPIEWKLIIDDRWMRVFGTDIHDEIKKRLHIDVPEILTIEALQELCNHYLYLIGICYHHLPHIEIRYVIDTNKFGYAHFGNFFFYQGNLYVFETDEKYKDQHNSGVVFATFGDECEGHGYAHEVIFAGVRTPYKDVKGDYIYTGDAVMTDRLGLTKDCIYGVQALDFWNDYGIMMDNHCLGLKDCQKIVRVGTVLFNLPKLAEMDMLHFIEQRSGVMHSWYGEGPTGEENLRHVRFTPNFFDSEIEYIVMENIRDNDFDWRKKVLTV